MLESTSIICKHHFCTDEHCEKPKLLEPNFLQPVGLKPYVCFRLLQVWRSSWRRIARSCIKCYPFECVHCDNYFLQMNRNFVFDCFSTLAAVENKHRVLKFVFNRSGFSQCSSVQKWCLHIIYWLCELLSKRLRLVTVTPDLLSMFIWLMLMIKFGRPTLCHVSNALWFIVICDTYPSTFCFLLLSIFLLDILISERF